MKKLLPLIIFFCSLNTNGQTYLISFAGKGASSTVTSVKVENLTSNTLANLNGSQVLRLNVITGIKPGEFIRSGELKIYPNPMTSYSVLKVTPPTHGKAVITITDITGKHVAEICNVLDNHLQEFRISGLPNGLFLISIKGNTYHYSEKILSTGVSSGSVNIHKVTSNIQTEDKKKPETGTKGEPYYIDMDYTAGDLLKYTSISGDFSTVTTEIPSSDQTVTFNFVPCTDEGNNSYPVVEIGTQTWMAKNLNTTKYQNGDLIPTTTPATLDISGESSPKYQWQYNGEETNADVYGRLYTWYAATDSRNVCPPRWHVPSDAEWTILTTYLGSSDIAGGKMKETATIHWSSPNASATNESGFTALPGGFRYSDGSYMSLNLNTYIWSTTATEATKAIYRFLHTNHGIIYSNPSKKVYGCSVRCLHNALPEVSTTDITAISSTTASGGGNITSDGGGSITSRGVCWSTSASPTTSDSKTDEGGGSGIFTSSLTGLTPNTTYYVRAFATNSEGISYGNEVSFKTNPEL